MAIGRNSVIWETIETIVVALILTLVIRHFVVESFVVRGSSMEPTLHDGQRLLVTKFSYRFGTPRPGDIIVFRSPFNPDDDLIKRVIATEGDTVELVRGDVHVNGSRREEAYIANHDSSILPPRNVPADRIFVLGDNRPNSEDSRFFGSVPVKMIKGKALVVWWPLPQVAVLH